MAEEAEKDMLFVAVTRPATKWGCPLEGVIVNFGISYLAFEVLAHGNILSVRGAVTILCFPITHFLMRLLHEMDHNMFRIVRLAAETRGIAIRGVTALWAMPWRLPAKPKDCASAL